MFDIGFRELFLILILALLIVRPERLPKAARADKTQDLSVGIQTITSPDIARRRTHNVMDLSTLQLLNQARIINCSVTICPIWFYEQVGVAS